jgi:DNA-binding transcriptional LysR family regulator
MTLHQLRIFESVARHLNVTEAAEKIHISQPALSHQLKLLEDEFAGRFHYRTGHGVELTERGRAFLEAIRPLLHQADSVEQKFKTNPSEETRFLKIGGTPSVSVAFLPKMVAIFKKTRPEVELVMETNTSRSIERRVLSSELEIGLVTNPSYSPLIVYEPYEEIRLVAFAAPSCPLAGKNVTAEQLARGPLIVRKDDYILEELVRRGYHPNVAAKCEAIAMDVVKGTVQRGMGIGILLWRTVEREIKMGLLKEIHVPELQKQFEGRAFIIYGKRKPLSGVAQEFVKSLHERTASGPRRTRKKARV